METKFLSPENSQLRFLDVRLKHESHDQMHICCAVWIFLVMASGIPVNFLSGPHCSRHEGHPSVICCGDFFEVFIKSSRFSLQGFGKRAAIEELLFLRVPLGLNFPIFCFWKSQFFWGELCCIFFSYELLLHLGKIPKPLLWALGRAVASGLLSLLLST